MSGRIIIPGWTIKNPGMSVRFLCASILSSFIPLHENVPFPVSLLGRNGLGIVCFADVTHGEHYITKPALSAPTGRSSENMQIKMAQFHNGLTGRNLALCKIKNCRSRLKMLIFIFSFLTSLYINTSYASDFTFVARARPVYFPKSTLNPGHIVLTVPPFV